MDPVHYIQALAALAAVLGLIAAIAWGAKRYGVAGIAAGARLGGRERRLRIVEILPLDARRRLVLIRRDGVEHLILTGPGSDLVIETGTPAPAEPVGSER